MNESRIEALLERIAVAVERLADHGIARGRFSTVESHEEAPATSDTHVTVPVVVPSSTPSVLESFLNAKGIRIKVAPTEDAADQIIDSLSLFLGERYDALSNLLAKIKRGMQSGKAVTESLKNRSQHEISSACQFCSRLHEVAFLEQYQYSRSPTYVIRAKTTTLPRAQRFFAGQWLERFILQKLKAVHSQVKSEVDVPLDVTYLINPQIVLPNGDDFELDILAAIGSAVYWIEAKSGDYQQHVAKYSKFARLLGLDYNHSLMVLTDAPSERCDALSSLFSMTVCNLRSVEEVLLSATRGDFVQRRAMAE